MQTQENGTTGWSGRTYVPERDGRVSIHARAIAWLRWVSRDISQAMGLGAHWLRYVVNLAIFAVLGYLCARLVWLLMSGATLPIDDDSVSIPQSILSAGQETENYDIFSEFDPFFRTTTLAPESVSSVAPETNLDLKLFGIRVGMESGAGTAIIQTPDKRQGAYAVGDEITSGVVLRRVVADRVVLSRNGVRESLSLNPDKEGNARVIQSNGQSQRPAVPSLPRVANTSISALLNQLKLSPRIQSGRINGFYVDADGADGALLNMLKLRPLDIVMAINDVSLVSIERIADVIEEVENSDSVTVTIERDGYPETFTLERPGPQR